MLATPKSYNTRAGITKTIINDLKYLTQIFIVEAGARRKGDIEEITKMVRPNVGVITSVGYQHLETFKSIDNVISCNWNGQILFISTMSDNTLKIGKYQNGVLDNIKQLKDTIRH